MMEQPVNLPRSALYFPTIEFQDEGWLRASLCIWDHVERIVPAGHLPRDSPDVRKLLDAGLIRSVDLTARDMELAATGFGRLLKLGPSTPSALSSGGRDFTRLHKGKVGERLHEFFNLVSRPSGSDDDWFGVPAELCHGYMMHLAQVVARRRGMAKVTDSKDSFAVTSFFDTGGALSVTGYSDEDKYGQAVLGLTCALPKAVRQLTIEDLIAFRKRTESGRAAMAQTIDRLAAGIAAIEDPRAARESLEQATIDLARSRELIATQSGLTVGDFARAVLCAGIPTMLGAIGVLADNGNPFAPITLAEGGLIALVASVTQAYVNRRGLQADPARSYYLELDTTVHRVFSPRYVNRENDFWAVLEEYIND